MKTEIIQRRLLICFIGLSAIPVLSLKGEQGSLSLHSDMAITGTYPDFRSQYDPESISTEGDTLVAKASELSDDIVFPDDRRDYCLNDKPFTITGISKSGDTGSFSIEGGVGLTDHHDNTATVYPGLLAAGTYAITFSYIHGKEHHVTENLTIGNIPNAWFTWDNECFQAGEAIHFYDNSQSNGETITEYKWLFSNGQGYDSFMTRNVAYTFTQPGNYMVSLEVTTSNGCRDATARVYALKPIIALAGQTYFEDFEDGPVTWQSGTSLQTTADSWSLGEPVKGFDGASSGDSCWFTYIEDFSAPMEQSWVSSPCFDFTGTERPMIKFDMWRLFDGTRDGTVLQATADNGKTWQNVGSISDGINWFNADNILGYPGDQSAGWSNIQDNAWTESRHGLDAYQGKTRVQFRIAYGSDGTARNTDGFAFDNIWIGRRDKMTLVEHFTNMSDPASAGADASVNELVSDNMDKVIDLQYHTSYPGPDLFNEQNPSVPDTRLLYYGLSDVPYSLLDGGSKEQHRFDFDLKPLDEGTVITQSLTDSKFMIATNASVVGNMLSVGADLSALQDIPTSELTLHIAVTENQIEGITGGNGETVFHDVVKTMLPDAGGTTFYQSWNRGEVQHVDYDWNMEQIYNLQELRIVAFIQDEETKEIYQSNLNRVTVQTGTEEHRDKPQDVPFFWVLSDPASTQATIRFNEPLKRDVTFELYNDQGSLVYTGNISSGSLQTIFSHADFPVGIYLIQLSDSHHSIGTAKLAVSR